MVSSYDILGIVYRHLNVTAVTSVITGEVYSGPEPINNQDENITINVLSNPGDYLQDGVMNVNIHVLGIKNKLPNSKRMKEIFDIVRPLVDDVVIIEENKPNVHLTILNETGPFHDTDNEGKHFHNIRLNFVTL